MSPAPIDRTTASTASVAGGLTMTFLGVIAAGWDDRTGDWWFLVAAAATAGFVVALMGLRGSISQLPVARRALGVAVPALGLFALSHLYATVDEDTALVLFSVFLLVSSVSIIVAGVVIAREATGPGRLAPLLCGAWPLVTVPAGAAISDVAHAAAIAGWGLCYVALGLVLRAPTRDHVRV